MASQRNEGPPELPKHTGVRFVEGHAAVPPNSNLAESGTIHHLPRGSRSISRQRSSSRGRSRVRRPLNPPGGRKGSLKQSVDHQFGADKGKFPLAQPARAPVPSSSNAAPARSWATVARSTTKGFDLTYVPPAHIHDRVVVDVPDVVLEASDPKWSTCLVGYFIGKRLPFKLIEAALKHVWGSHLEEILVNDDGFYFFSIPDNAYRKEILDNGCFTVAKVPLILQQFHPFMDLQKAKHQAVPIWIRLRHLPYSLWSAIGISTVASAVGRPMYVDNQTERMNRISFARVCVEVEGGQQLPLKIDVRMGGEMREVLVEYEWKPSYCPSCATFGHRCPPPKAPRNHAPVSPVSPARAGPSSSHDPIQPPQDAGWQTVGRKASDLNTNPAEPTSNPSLPSTANPAPEDMAQPTSRDSRLAVDPPAVPHEGPCSSLSEDAAEEDPPSEEESVHVEDGDTTPTRVPSTLPEETPDPTNFSSPNTRARSKKGKGKNKQAPNAESSSTNTGDTPRLRVAPRSKGGKR